MTGNIDLLLPGLFDLPGGLSDALADLPGLARILRFARPIANHAHNVDANIADMLQWTPPTTAAAADSGFHGLPVAWAYAESGRATEAVLFEAVHLRPDMQQAIVTPVGRRRSDLADTRRLIVDLGAEFAEDFACAEIGNGVYLMSLHRLQAPDSYPHPLSALGRPANPHISRGQGQLAWYRLLTEIQMYLHSHAVNGERLARGVPPINSLWFWGAGQRPPQPGRQPTWYCSDPVLRHFGERLGLECPDPESIPDGRDDLAVVDLRLLSWLKTGGDDELSPLLASLDTRLLQPLLSRVEHRRAVLRLRAGSECDYRLSPWSLKCFWRGRYRAVESRDGRHGDTV